MPPPAFELANLDAVRWLQDQPSESIELLITDPAYESLEKHRAVGTTTRLKHSKASSNDWFRIFPNARFGELFAEAYRVLRRNTHFYLLCDAETMFVRQTGPNRPASSSGSRWSGTSAPSAWATTIARATSSSSSSRRASGA